MSFKVVNALSSPNMDRLDFGEKLLEPFDVTLVKNIEQTEDSIIENCKDADAVIGSISHANVFNRKVLEQMSKCRVIAGPSIAFETIDLAAATDCGIAVANNPDYCLDEVSGRVIGFMLALSYKFFQIDKVVKEEGIPRGQLMRIAGPVARTQGQTLGLVGLGRIGTIVAQKARGLGIRVVSYDPYVFEGFMRALNVEPVDMDTLLKESDFISVHVPVTPATQNFVGYEEFKKMKPTCYFINASRGAVVDEAALVRALDEKLIAGAGIDVTVKEPIERDSPLLKMSNVILTNHSGWYSTAAAHDLFFNPMTQVVLALQGQWPLYAVNPQIRGSWLAKWGAKS
ncbi:C-terminal binding protein [Chloroflexota bacterium]